MTEIKKGDHVRHKTLFMNGGVPMNVIDVQDGKALCNYFEGKEMIDKQTWIELSQLDKVIYGSSDSTKTD